MKKSKLLILTLASLCLTSCGEQSNKIGIYIYSGTDTFISELTYYLKNKMDDYEYKVFDASESQVTQNEQILDSINNSYNYLLVNTVDRLASSAIVEKCQLSNIPLIFFNREPLEEDIYNKDNVYYVGTSAELAGIYQADMAADLFGTPSSLNAHYDKNGDNIIQLVIIKGENGHQDAELRTKYCTSHLKELGYNIEVLSVETANWNRLEGYDAMEKQYKEYEDSIELVLSNNDDMALGAIDYLLNVGAFKSGVDNSEQIFSIFGVDATDVGRRAIRDGYLSGTVLNDAEGQATAIKTLLDYQINNKDFKDFPYEFSDGNRIYIDETKITIKDI
ncbi:MAG: galactose ABC transporter substrate-binding protein [Bacilli bacterium]